MKMPPNMTEAQVIEVANRVIALIAPSFAFGYYDYDDISQECWILIIKALNKYDGIRPLSNFLYTHLRNRLLNLWRDKYYRIDAPCKMCHEAHMRASVPMHDNRDFCKKYKRWILLNNSKRDIASPINFGDAVNEDRNYQSAREPYDDIIFDELIQYIDEHLDVGLRTTYKRMLAGERVVTKLRKQVEASIARIIEEYNGEARAIIKS